MTVRRIASRLTRALCSFALVLPHVLQAQDAPAQEPVTGLVWHDLIDGMRFERQRLQSGIYVATGAEMPWNSDREAPVRIYSAFSFPDGKIRFDHESRGYTLRGGQPMVEDTHRVVCLLPDRTLHFSNLTPLSLILAIAPAKTLSIKSRPGTRGYLDPRCLGLIETHKLYDGITFDEAARKWADAVTSKPAVLSNEGDGVIRSTILGPGRMSWWIDTHRGFTLVRFLREAGMVDPESGEFLRLSEFIRRNNAFRARLEERGVDWQKRSGLDVPEEVELGWVQVRGVWVPSSYRHVTTTQEKGDDSSSDTTTVVERVIALRFDWSSVNEDVDDGLFDFANFGLPDGTSVVDYRTGVAEFVEKIGAQPSVKRVDLGDGGRRVSWVVIVAFNFVIAAAILCFVMLRRRWTRRGDGS